MRTKNSFLIACSLTMLCATAWIMANLSISAAASSAIPMPASIDTIKLIIEPADAVTGGATATVSELISMASPAWRQLVIQKVSASMWSGDTKVRFWAVQYRVNGVWRAMPANWDQRQVLMISQNGCPVACPGTRDPRGDPGGFSGENCSCGQSDN